MPLRVEALIATNKQSLAILYFFADREGDTARRRENPPLHRPETQRIRAVLLTSYKHKINELTQLTQPLTSHHITSLFYGPQVPAFWPKTVLFSARNFQALST